MAMLASVDARTGFVPAGTARLHFRVVGEGPSIVVLHGGPDFNYDYLLPDLDRLAERFRVIYYDQRGRGRSADGVRPGDVSIVSEMNDLDQVRIQFGLETMAVLGHSWGAVLAMEYATRHPERLSRLIFVNTAPASNQDAQAFREHLLRIRPAVDVAAMNSLAATGAGPPCWEPRRRECLLPDTFPPGPQAGRATVDQLLPRLRRNFTPERVLLARAIEQRLYDETWGSSRYDLLVPLRRLVVPTLVIHGEDDLVPVELAAHIADAIPGTRLVVLRHCGHFAYLEAPDVLVRRVEELFGY